MADTPTVSSTSLEVDGTPPALAAKLREAVTKTLEFLNDLTQSKPVKENVARAPAMPQSAFRGAKAFAFSFRNKKAFLGTIQSEIGFVTVKITHPDGSISWSPPYFFKGFIFGLGLAVGWQRSRMLLALMNDDAVTNATKSRKLFGVRGDFLVDMDGSYVRKVSMDSTSQEDNVVYDGNGGMMARYFKMDALMVNLGLEYGYIRPAQINKKLYGDASPEEILAGKVQGPIEFRGVIDALTRHTEASMPRRNTKDLSIRGGQASRGEHRKASRERLAGNSNSSIDVRVE